MSTLVEQLRAADMADRISAAKTDAGQALQAEFVRSGVKFACSPEPLAHTYYAAVNRLADCVRPDSRHRPVLQEGGVYHGCWIESTGTINAELLARFCPDIAGYTFELFADLQREDGLMPYKVTADGPAFKQIQLVTPPARSIWHHYRLNGCSKTYLSKMFAALKRYDAWLAEYRNTRGTGCVEAFCTFDTGHDASSRFWHIPDTPYLDDPKRYDPSVPTLPLLAPDLTASVYCSRKYLAHMADELGYAEEAEGWRSKAAVTLKALYTHCYHEEDECFYDVDAAGRHVRLQSDVLLRVLASEAADDALFARALSRYLLNTRKFFAKYPFTSIAMDDPRFDPHSSYNSWGGAVNFLSLIRTPHAFEHHGRYVELTWVMQPILSALSRMTRFGQVLSPWTGEEGYTEAYSPAILCLLDYIERLSGIMPAADGELWFTGLLPQTRDHGVKLADETAYSRIVNGVYYELHNTRESCMIYRDGELMCRFPAGARVVLDRSGAVKKVIGMTAHQVEGVLDMTRQKVEISFAVKGNQVLRLKDGCLVSEADPGIILPTYE